MKNKDILCILYIKIINSIALLSCKIPPRIRVILFNASVTGISLLGIVAYSNKRLKSILHYQDYALCLSLFLLIILLLSSINKKIDINKLERRSTAFWGGWYLCFLSILISSFLYPVEEAYFLMGVTSLTVFPMFMIVWQDGEARRLAFNLIAKCMVYASFAFLIINLIIVPFITNDYYESGNSAYLGIVGNPNSNGLIVLPFFTAALYLAITEKRIIQYIMSISICILFACLSSTRTVELAMIAEAIVALVIVIKNQGLYPRKKSKPILVIAIIIIAISMVLGHILLQIDKMDMNVYAENEFEEASGIVWENEELIKINNITSGRLVLWMAYVKSMTFEGHGNPSGPLFKNYNETKWAHNNALDIWYASGFPAFAGYVLWLLCGWGFIIRCLINKAGFRKEYLLTILAFIGYFTEAMLEITLYPMYTGIAFLCFVTLGPIAFKEKTDEA